MADLEVITIPLCLPRDEAAALAQLVKRFGYDDAERLSARHDGGAERTAVLNSIGKLQTALAGARLCATLTGGRDKCRVRSIAGRDHARIEAVDVGMIEDDTPPPGPLSLGWSCDEIEKAGSSPKACKRRVITAMDDGESQHAVKSNGTRHIVRGQRDGPDAFNHCGTGSVESETRYESP
jgi:hypothetical protein